jgi:acyl-CoA thioester hydrolase
MHQTFVFTIRVYYEDTDAGGVVYYANYLKYFERARTEWLRALGFEQDELARRERLMFVVRSARLEFLKPARFNDLIEVSAAIAERRGASLTFAQHIRPADTRRRGETLCTAEVRIAGVDVATGAPRRLPAALVARLEETNA